MSAKQYHVYLSEEQRIYLHGLTTKGTDKARKINRARILLLADESNNVCKKDKEIVESLGTSESTVRRVRKRFVEEGIEPALNEKDRPGKPPTFTGRNKAQITAIACTTPPVGRNRWSLRLLADRVVELGVVNSISHQTVKEVLKKTKLNPT